MRATFRVVHPDALARAVREAARPEEIVAVAGGDGTLSTAAEAVAETDAILAPFPLGTHNHFARRLKIDSLTAAAMAVARGGAVRVAIGSVAGRAFVHHASAGFYPRMVRVRERIRHWSGKSMGNVLAAAYVLMHLDARSIGLRVQGVTRKRTVPGLWVGLGSRAFRLPVDGHAPVDGTLEVLVPEIQSRVGFVLRGLRTVWLMKRGMPVEGAGVEVISTESFTLESDQAVDISRDGEVERRDPPLEFRVHPEALRVLSLAES
jgi:undecaprenyl-diphosphatase